MNEWLDVGGEKERDSWEFIAAAFSRILYAVGDAVVAAINALRHFVRHKSLNAMLDQACRMKLWERTPKIDFPDSIRAM